MNTSVIFSSDFMLFIHFFNMRYFLFPVSRIKSLCYTEAFIAPASSEAGATGGRSPIPIPNTLLETP